MNRQSLRLIVEEAYAVSRMNNIICTNTRGMSSINRLLDTAVGKSWHDDIVLVVINDGNWNYTT